MFYGIQGRVLFEEQANNDPPNSHYQGHCTAGQHIHYRYMALFQ